MNYTTRFLQKETLLSIRQSISPLVVICVFMLFAITKGFSQNNYQEIIKQAKSKNFNKIVETVETYYSDKDKGKGTGYKQFKRWEDFNRTRLDEKGNVQNISQIEFDEMNSYKLRRSKGSNEVMTVGTWTSMGPNSHILTTGWNGGIGRVNCVTVDPSNSNIIYVGTPDGGLWRSTTGGNAWTPLTDGITAIGVSGIAIDPTSPAANRTIYILTGDGDGGYPYSIGVLKSINNGATWSSTGLSWVTTDYANGSKLVMYPGSSSTLFAATTHGIYRTTNAGLSWTLVLNTAVKDIEFKPGSPLTMYASGSGAFWRSTNGGASWTQITTGLPAAVGRFAIAVSPANANYVYLLNGTVPAAGQYGGVYRSTNSGLSFSLRSNTPNILGYADDGSDASNQAWYDLAIAASPTNAEEVHTGGINCWKSTNGGTTLVSTSKWVEGSAGAGNYTHADIHTLEFFGSSLYCGSDGGIFRSTNNANDWADISTGLVITQMYRISIDPTNPDKFICGTQDNGTNRYEGGNFYHWIGADGMQCVIDYSNPNIQYGCSQGGGGMHKTINNGTSMTTITPAGAGGGNWITPYVIDPLNSNILYAGYTNLWKTINGGTSWTNITSGAIGAGGCDHIAVAPSNTQVMYVSKWSTLYKTTNGGTTWATVNGTGSNILPGIGITWFEISPTNHNTVWLTVGSFSSGKKVYRTTDGGANWTNISGTLPNLPANTIVYSNNGTPGLYIGMDAGVYFRSNAATDWTPFKTGLPNVIVQELEIRGNKLYAGTFGRGMWRTEVQSCTPNFTFSGTQSGVQTFEAQSTITSSAWLSSGSIQYQAGTRVTLQPGFKTDGSSTFFRSRIAPCTALAPNAENEVAGEYVGPMAELVQQIPSDKVQLMSVKAFPNPFASTTTIEYALPEDGILSIEVIDMLGKTIATIVNNESYKAGIYRYNFEAIDLNNGVYSCVVKHNGRIQSTLLMINK